MSIYLWKWLYNNKIKTKWIVLLEMELLMVIIQVNIYNIWLQVYYKIQIIKMKLSIQHQNNQYRYCWIMSMIPTILFYIQEKYLILMDNLYYVYMQHAFCTKYLKKIQNNKLFQCTYIWLYFCVICIYIYIYNCFSIGDLSHNFKFILSIAEYIKRCGFLCRNNIPVIRNSYDL